jgi:hypothetical protein
MDAYAEDLDGSTPLAAAEMFRAGECRWHRFMRGTGAVTAKAAAATASRRG